MESKEAITYLRALEIKVLDANKVTDPHFLSDDDVKKFAENLATVISDDPAQKDNFLHFKRIQSEIESTVIVHYKNTTVRVDMDDFKECEEFVGILRKHLPEIPEKVGIFKREFNPVLFRYEPTRIYEDEHDKEFEAYSPNYSMVGPLGVLKFPLQNNNKRYLFFRLASAAGIPLTEALNRYEAFSIDAEIPADTVFVKTIVEIWSSGNALQKLNLILLNKHIAKRVLEDFEKQYPDRQPKTGSWKLENPASNKRSTDGASSESKRTKIASEQE